jgi:hypothetical protein
MTQGYFSRLYKERERYRNKSINAKSIKGDSINAKSKTNHYHVGDLRFPDEYRERLLTRIWAEIEQEANETKECNL